MSVSLQSMNSFGVDSQAEKILRVGDIETIRDWIEENPGESRFILGGGSNVLFVGDPEVWILRNELKGREILKRDANSIILEVAAGENWHETVSWTVEQGYGGLENLALIPGSVGAAPVQNIGAYGVELKDVFESLEYIDLDTGESRNMNVDQCRFGYRNSLFKTQFRNKAFITKVNLRLTIRDHEIHTHYGAIRNYLSSISIEEVTPKDVFKAVVSIRQEKLPDPDVLGNAGSFFKNPVIPETLFDQLIRKFPEIPSYPAAEGYVKLAAGWLIEKAGWKGKRIGEVGTYHKQALVIVNHGGASGKEILDFGIRIKAAVFKKFGIVLEEEVNIVQ